MQRTKSCLLLNRGDAARHGGFIPWDFDLDIAMPRKDYDNIKDYYSTHPSDVFFFEDYDSERLHNSPHAILRVKNTHVITDRSRRIDTKIKHNGLLLDIFPLDKAPVDENLRAKQKKDILSIKKIIYYKEAQRFPGTRGLRYFSKLVISLFLSPISFKRLNKKLEKIETRFEDSDSPYLVSMSSHYSYEKQMMEKEIYGVPSKIVFEGKEYYAPQSVHGYLSKLYGDNYMTPPSEEGRYDDLYEITFIDDRARNG